MQIAINLGRAQNNIYEAFDRGAYDLKHEIARLIDKNWPEVVTWHNTDEKAPRSDGVKFDNKPVF